MNIDFLLTSLIVVASPGTGVLYTVACGLSRGVRTGVVPRHSRFSLYQLMISECQDCTQSRSQPEYP